MDIYTNPSSTTYVKGFTKRFMMPTDSGGIPAVAVSRRSASLIVSAYTILILLIFMVGWNLILSIIMGFWKTHRNPNRYIALVALWNSGESMNAAILMLEYCKRMLSDASWVPEKSPGDKAGGSTKTDGSPETGGDLEVGQGQYSGTGEQDGIGSKVEQDDIGSKVEQDDIRSKVATTVTRALEPPPRFYEEHRFHNLCWGILFLFLAVAMSVGNIVAGILVAGELLMGNVAPANKDSIFFPDVSRYARDDDNGASDSKLYSLKAPSALRALGSIEASAVTVRKRVNLVPIDAPGGGNGRNPDGPWLGRTYDYDVTGVDMGLQTEPGLTLKVNGSCYTEYTWLQDSTDTNETYKLFGGDQTYSVQVQPNVKIPPMVDLVFNKKDIDSKNPNITFALIVNTAGRFSYTSGEDAWFYTEQIGDTGLPHVVRRKRPVFSCWETRRWHLNGKDVETSKIDTLPGLRLHKLWIDVFKWEFAFPRMVSMGRAAGAGALKSATYSVAPEFILDAGASNTEKDLERLVLASWVSSRNVLRDTTTYEEGGMAAMSEGPRGGVEADAAKFVLQTGDVGTLSVRILISVPAILLFLFVVQMCLSCVVKHKSLGLGKNSKFHDYVTRGISLQATQLYRYLDEELYGRARWVNRLASIPALKGPPNYNRKELQPAEKDQHLPGSARRETNPRYSTGTSQPEIEREVTKEDGKKSSFLHECSEPRPIMLKGSRSKGELTVARREDPEEDFKDLKRGAFNNV